MAGATIAVTGTVIEIGALTGVIVTMIAVSAATAGRRDNRDRNLFQNGQDACDRDVRRCR